MKKEENLVRCAHNGNDGMLEYWNDQRKIYFSVDFLSFLYYIKI